MKAKDIIVLKEKVLDMLPITQAEMWKNLGIGRRDGARLVGIMVHENIIKRTKSVSTFLLERLNGEKRYDKKKKSKYSPLLSKSGTFSPCCGCGEECNSQTCELLIKWVM